MGDRNPSSQLGASQSLLTSLQTPPLMFWCCLSPVPNLQWLPFASRVSSNCSTPKQDFHHLAKRTSKDSPGSGHAGSWLISLSLGGALLTHPHPALGCLWADTEIPSFLRMKFRCLLLPEPLGAHPPSPASRHVSLVSPQPSSDLCAGCVSPINQKVQSKEHSPLTFVPLHDSA